MKFGKRQFVRPKSGKLGYHRSKNRLNPECAKVGAVETQQLGKFPITGANFPDYIDRYNMIADLIGA